MEESKAIRTSLITADHMVSVTYTSIQDPKILLSVASSLKNIIMRTITFTLQQEKIMGLIPAYGTNHVSQIDHFAKHSSKRSGITPPLLEVLSTLQDIEEMHKNANVEFTRNSELIMAQENFDIKKISKENIQDLLKKTKTSVEAVLVYAESLR